MFLDVVEGKDQPKDRGKPEFEADYGETGCMMMGMTKPLFGIGKAVVTDSSFCVPKGIVGMLAHGLYGTMVIKKKYIGTITTREMPLRHVSKRRRLEIFIMFVVIWMDTGKR